MFLIINKLNIKDMSDPGKTIKKERLEKTTKKTFWTLDDLEEGLKSTSMEEKKESLWILRNLQRLNR
jgi:hypothetical protein